jgi:Zn finger protein HypA/HybF involved in hydrogenase expression
MVMLRQLQGSSAQPLIVKELYPNTWASGTQYPDPGDGVNAQNEGVRCDQCGYPIPDRRTAKVCPHCGSDNFEGQQLSK